jgi:hypothetical protein
MAEEEVEKEIEEPVEKTLTALVRRLYRERTGKEWEEEPPSEEEAKSYVREAAKSLMEKWQKSLAQYYEMTRTVLGAPKPPEYALVYYHEGKIVKHRAQEVFTKGTHKKIVPLLDTEPARVPSKAILKCPFDPTHGFSMKPILPGVWQCTINPAHLVSITTYFPARPP